jgi:1,5-anhydro-D-fructose reductase (1,5-anhydro-D-mannitol-forming)
VAGQGGGGIGWGIVGYGWVARDFMAPAIRAAGDRLVAVCDPAPTARAAAADAHGRDVRGYDDLAAFAADSAVEAVYVATPNHLHRRAVEAVAAAGKAVLCEKPMAASLADAEAIAAAVRGAGIFYGTAFDQRHHPAHRAIRDLLRAGRIGTVTALRIVYACWLDRNFAPLPGHDNWRVDRARAGGGAFIDLAPHGIDLAGFLLDDPLVEVATLAQRRVHDYAVQADGQGPGVDDGAMLVGRTGGGVLANLHVAYNHPDQLPRRRLEVVGTRGLIVAENTMGLEAGGRVTLTGLDGAPMPVDFDGTASPFLEQVRAFGAALRDPGLRAAWSVERDIQSMRLVARAGDEIAAPATRPGAALRGAA